MRQLCATDAQRVLAAEGYLFLHPTPQARTAEILRKTAIHGNDQVNAFPKLEEQLHTLQKKSLSKRLKIRST